MTIGVLALQGNYAAHLACLARLGVSGRPVLKPAQLIGLSGLIIPGGESSALLHLMRPLDFTDAIVNFHAEGGFLFGACAGMILLARQVEPQQSSVALIDITVLRNAYGRQLESFVGMGYMKHMDQNAVEPVPLVFIRAPIVTEVGSQVDVLLTLQQQPVLLRQDRVMVASFHPEMGDDTRVYQLILDSMRNNL